jgi:hypothetical protein
MKRVLLLRSRSRAGRQEGACVSMGQPVCLPHSIGVLASVCGGLVMLLPETKGIALPETVDDVEKLGRYGTQVNTP